MAEEKKGGVTVYISPDIVEALKERHQQNKSRHCGRT